MTWQSESPKPGAWWVSIHPDRREGCSAAIAVTVCKSGEVIADGGSIYTPLAARVFEGALWLPRETPADPFEVAR